MQSRFWMHTGMASLLALVAMGALPSCCDTDDCSSNVLSGGGTWEDPTSGLTWQVMPAGEDMSWSKAKAYCAGLSLDGVGWHLPSIWELRTLIRGCPATEDGGSCSAGEGDCLVSSCLDDSCIGCYRDDGPDDGCYQPDEIQGSCIGPDYWSSSLEEGSADAAWSVGFAMGDVCYRQVLAEIRVRCVR